MAGIWQDWEHDGEITSTCAIVTTAANAAMASIHHRIPVILTAQDWPLWLGEAGKGASRIMKSAPEDALSFHRVGLDVNSNRATGAGLIVPIA
jgi:putative SOS response-associated peptidase YedK